MNIRNLIPATPFWIGAGLVVLAPIVSPVLNAASRKVTKAIAFNGVRAFLMLKATSMAAIDAVADICEEARDELAETERKGRA